MRSRRPTHQLVGDFRNNGREYRPQGNPEEVRIHDFLIKELGRAVPGTSKWNKIEHRLFSFISQNWRAQPLVSYRVIVDLISATTTKTGLTVRCELDTGQYPNGIVVSDAEMAAINIKRAEFRGEWNYTISPKAYPPDCAFIS